MDKQFLRILMLSVLLPAGAALGQAIQREHVSFATVDQNVISKLTTGYRAGLTRTASAEERDRHTQRAALGAAELDEVR